jgi:hypothetical protein
MGETAMQRTAFILAVALAAGGAALAQSASPFDRLAGQWSGNGTIELAGGNKEPIKCRAAYDIPNNPNNLQLSIRCASDSYNFELRASANYSGGNISGNWSEATRNAAGTLSGKADGSRFQVQAISQAFTAGLTLVTHGNNQTVTIKSQDAQANVKGATISLKRTSVVGG